MTWTIDYVGLANYNTVTAFPVVLSSMGLLRYTRYRVIRRLSTPKLDVSYVKQSSLYSTRLQAGFTCFNKCPNSTWKWSSLSSIWSQTQSNTSPACRSSPIHSLSYTMYLISGTGSMSYTPHYSQTYIVHVEGFRGRG